MSVKSLYMYHTLVENSSTKICQCVSKPAYPEDASVSKNNTMSMHVCLCTCV